NEGDTVTVGTLVGYLLEAGEEPPDVRSVKTASPHVARTAIVEYSKPASEQDMIAPLTQRETKSGGRLKISPRAARLATKLGVDASAINGTGKTGRIRECDVQAAADASRSPSRTASPRRRTIASRMLDSSCNTASVTLTTRADATNLVSLRRQFKAGESETVPSYQDIIMKLTAEALRQHPELNSDWTDDGPLQHDDVHIGFAVDTDAGLLVPVIQNVDRLGLLEVSSRRRKLAELARRGKLSMPLMSGGTFSITSLGAYGVDAFTPIINTPQTAILGIGTIRRVAMVLEDDRIAPGDQLTISLTFDHRATDGAPAARFLKTIVQGIENPSAWLIK
ncbi:MAG: dihydrolipoamide acetyltransferase family protein, partial [Planctomycetota bacterium]|nr:dihydrolipoamide acetyltransferase family protein [Planctomycetota bacterium]